MASSYARRTAFLHLECESRLKNRQNWRHGLTGVHLLCQTCPMTDVNQEDVSHALEILGLTLPVTPETLAQTRRALLHTWNPARYSNLTNNPKKYMQAYKKAEEMTTLIEAAYTLLSAVLVPDEASDVNR
jgi:hypothetical protein